MFIASLNAFRKAWGKFPAFVALVALIASSLVAIDVPEPAVAAGTSSCSTTNTYTTSNGYCTVSFTTAGTDSWTVPANVDSIDVLAVGGGGGSNRGICSYTYGAGAGGGGVLEVLGKSVTSGTVLSVVVGGGGTGTNANCVSLATATSSPFTSPNGGNTSVTTTSGSSVNLIANGGRGSRTQYNFATAASSGSTSIDGLVTAGTAGGSFNWDSTGGCTQTDCANGGGGGAGAAASGLNGGAGVTSVITGNSYGGGGGGTKGSGDGSSSSGGASAAACDAPANRGGGGSDCHKLGTARGGNGGSGIVVIRYLVKPTVATQPANVAVTNSPTRTATFSVGAVTTASSLTSPTVTYQWEESTDGGTTWANVSTGTGGTTNSYTTATLPNTSKNGYKYRVKITQTSGSISNYNYSNSATLSVTTDAAAPTSVVALSPNNTEMAIGWSAPTTNGAAVITGYSIIWSTTSDFAAFTTVNTGSTNTYGIVSNLTANTTYYFKVYATGSGWSGTLSDVASATTKSATTSIDINLNATTVEGTDYVLVGGGILVPKTATSITLSATALQNLLATKNVVLSAARINLNTPIAWSANTVLTFGTHYSTTINIYRSITASGDTAGVSITPTMYYMWTGAAPKIQLTGSNPSLKIGLQNFIVVNTVAKLANVTATSKWALGQNLTLTDTYTTSVLPMTFTGEFDGLGNSISNMKINVGSAGNYGFFTALGANTKVRYVTFDNISIRNSTANIQKRIGALAGAVTSAPVSLERVTSTGTIIESATSGNSEIGGILGGVTSTSGTTTILKSNSQTNIISGVPDLAIGGILGTNVSTYGSTSGAGGTVSISLSWNSGDIQRTNNGGWYGSGGIMGVHLGSAATIFDSYNLGTINSTGSDTTTNIGGILGYSSTTTPATVSNSYTSTGSCGAGTTTNCTASVVPGTQLAALTSFWTKNATYGTFQHTAERPVRNVYVRVAAPSNNSYSGVSYEFVNGLGQTLTTSDLTALNLTVTGTPSYTITSDSPNGNYDVSYVSGLSFTGTPTAIYKILPWRETTAVTLGNASQQISFDNEAPTGKGIGDTYTVSATATSGLPVTFGIAAESSSVCSINDSTITFTGLGDCVVTANQPGLTGAYLAATQVTQTISVGKGLQFITWTGSAPTGKVVDGASFTPVATGGASGNAVTFTVHNDSAGICAISNGAVSFQSVGDCVVLANQLGNDNWEAAAETSMTIEVGKGTQLPVSLSVSDNQPVYAPGLSLTLYLTGGAGEGQVWFESLTPQICNTDGRESLEITHAGTCTVVGHKDADSNYESTFDTLTFEVGKASLTDVTMGLANVITYSSTEAMTSAIVVDGVISGGFRTFTVVAGTCTVNNGNLVATEAGDCEVQLNIAEDPNYLGYTLNEVFTIAKATQSNVTAIRQDEQPVSVAYAGVRTTVWEVSGGSGTGEITVAVGDSAVCSAVIANYLVTVTGLAAGNCEITVTKAGDDNYNEATTRFVVSVVHLPAGPSAITIANTGTVVDGNMQVTVSWTSATQANGHAAVSGFELQAKNGDAWTTVSDGIVNSSVTSITISVPVWTKVQLRVAAISSLDPIDITLRDWTNFTGTSGGDEPVDFPVPGALRLISTNIAAVTSGEIVTLTGSGFDTDPSVITNVQLNSSSSVFNAGIGIAATSSNSTTLRATVISETQLTFVLPKITMPKGVNSLTTNVKVVVDGVASQTVLFNYIPKKLSQTLTVSPTLPTASTIINARASLITNSVVTWTGAAPVVTATPSTVCNAFINSDRKVVINGLTPGACTVTVQAPQTPGYTASIAKTAKVTVKDSRTTGFTVSLNENTEQFQLGDRKTFSAADTLLTPGLVNVYVGDNQVELPVTLSTREGTVLFTVDAADEASGLCTADPGDTTTGLLGSITISGAGDCDVIITNPADSGWYVGETVRLTVRGTQAQVTTPDTGSATELTPEELANLAQELDPKDPDDPTTPPVALTIDPNTPAGYEFGGEDGLDYDPVAGKFTIRSKSMLVGTWTAVMKQPKTATGKWFKIGKLVKKTVVYTEATSCSLKLVVKKDPKLKKRVTRTVGSCLLSDTGKAAMRGDAPSSKIVMKYKRIRQWPKTALDYVKSGSAKIRYLKRINRTIVLRIGRATN